MTNTVEGCGTCALCCKVMNVPELKKPEGQWCVHANPGADGGCTIYDQERPAVCGDFACVWLQLQQHTDRALESDLRPDRCGVVFSLLTNNTGLSAHVDPAKPEAWTRGAAARFIDRTLASGLQVVIAVGNKRKLLIGRRR